jgi:hypothetical protein
MPQEVWQVKDWKMLYEPDDAKRKGSRSPLQYIKFWVDGSKDIDRQRIEGIKRALMEAGGFKLTTIWQWMLSTVAERSHFRGYFLSAMAARPATAREIAVMIGVDLVTAEDVQWAIGHLHQLGLIERINLSQVFETLNNDGIMNSVYLVSGEVVTGPAEKSGNFPQNSGAVTRTGTKQEPEQEQEQEPTALASSGNCETRTQTKTRTESRQLTSKTGGGDGNYNPTGPDSNENVKQRTRHRDNPNDNDGPDGPNDNKTAHRGNGTPPATAPVETDGESPPCPPVRPDGGGEGNPPPAGHQGPTERPQPPGGGDTFRPPNAEAFAMIIFEALGWSGGDMKVRNRNNEKASYKNKWMAYIAEADRLSLSDEDICDFAQRRYRKAKQLASTEVNLRQDDLKKWTRREATVKARARIWMAEFEKLLVKLRDTNIEHLKPGARSPP